MLLCFLQNRLHRPQESCSLRPSRQHLATARARPPSSPEKVPRPPGSDRRSPREYAAPRQVGLPTSSQKATRRERRKAVSNTRSRAAQRPSPPPRAHANLATTATLPSAIHPLEKTAARPHGNAHEDAIRGSADGSHSSRERKKARSRSTEPTSLSPLRFWSESFEGSP